jgi:large subunit ribosomal protein L10
MALTKKQKAELIDQYTTTFSSDNAIVLVEQRGLPVDGIVSFKKELATTSGTSRVVKKRLLLQTAEKNGFDAVDLGTLNGSLVAISTSEEDFSPLKAVVKMNKLFKRQGLAYGYSFLWGWYGKTWKDASYVSELANIPSKEELVGKFLYLLKYPVQSMAAVLDQIAKKKAE